MNFQATNFHSIVYSACGGFFPLPGSYEVPGDVRECRDGRASIMRSITSSHGCYEKRGIGGGKWGVADILLEGGRGKKPSFTLMGNRIDARL